MSLNWDCTVLPDLHAYLIIFLFIFQTYFSKDSSTPPNAARDTITDLSSKAFDSTDKGNRKISSNMTYSTDMTENGTSAGVEGNL